MRRIVKRIAVAVGAALALLSMEWVREGFASPADLRAFDPAEVGRLDTAMWRSYYERHEVRLFRQMIQVLREQYGMPPLRAVVNAYRAAHAAFVFKDGRKRTDYRRALPDLEAYYADISKQATRGFDSKKVAKLELEWWIVHREDPHALPPALAELQAAIYGIPVDKLAEHGRLRTEAMVLRDAKDRSITEKDWVRIGALLEESWRSLHRAVNAR